MAIINNFTQIIGKHCETTATNALLKHIGIEVSEPMLFGIGQGLSFIYWDMKTMEFPFLGGRNKQFQITRNFCDTMGLNLDVKVTTSIKKAWKNVKENIDQGIPVGLQLDFFYLDYVTEKTHFGGHFVTMYGYDEVYGYLVDTANANYINGEGKATLKNIELARSEKGPMAPKNLSYTITRGTNVEKIENILLKAIKANAETYLKPPIKNISYQGIIKTAEKLPNLLKSGKNIEKNFKLTARLMESGGTGGSIFRNIYRDFLKESYDMLGLAILKKSYEEFFEIATMWKRVIDIFESIKKTDGVDKILAASTILKEIAHKEKATFEMLKTL